MLFVHRYNSGAGKISSDIIPSNHLVFPPFLLGKALGLQYNRSRFGAGRITMSSFVPTKSAGVSSLRASGKVGRGWKH